MKNKDLPAMPAEWKDFNSLGEQIVRESYHGLTKREMFAKDLACAYLSGVTAWTDGLDGGEITPTPEKVANEAIAYADALLDALDADMMMESE